MERMRHGRARGVVCVCRVNTNSNSADDVLAYRFFLYNSDVGVNFGGTAPSFVWFADRITMTVRTSVCVWLWVALSVCVHARECDWLWLAAASTTPGME